ncbi:unnamed protein product [Protopolystoma xenopodis]|uniref:Secreted protein n=1 Tax=Protopolystoma xenopodis TaxID=117903 RepID=A0A448XJ42_9PLAT|nr:unnamed protein product [Protopolystoma xenopodis]
MPLSASLFVCVATLSCLSIAGPLETRISGLLPINSISRRPYVPCPPVTSFASVPSGELDEPSQIGPRDGSRLVSSVSVPRQTDLWLPPNPPVEAVLEAATFACGDGVSKGGDERMPFRDVPL